MTMPEQPRNPLITEPWLMSLSERLDELGRSERRGAPPELEARLLEQLRATEPAGPSLRYVPAPHLARRPMLRLARLPVAAALMIAATLAAVWLARQGTTRSTSTTELAALTLEQDVDAWLSRPEAVGQEFDSEIAALSEAASRLSGGSSEDGTAVVDLWLEEGAL